MNEPQEQGRSVNRPANNARQARPEAVLREQASFGRDTGAEDFLGLNADLQAAAPVGAAQPQVAQPQPVEVEPTESWLLEMPGEAAPESALAPQSAEYEPEEVVTSPLLNTTWTEHATARRSRRWMAPVAGLCVVGALALVGYPRLSKVLQQPAETEPSVASNTPPRRGEARPASVVEQGPAPVELGPAELAALPQQLPPPASESAYVEPSRRENTEYSRAEVSAPRSGALTDELVEVVDPAAAAYAQGLASSGYANGFEADSGGMPASADAGDEASASFEDTDVDGQAMDGADAPVEDGASPQAALVPPPAYAPAIEPAPVAAPVAVAVAPAVVAVAPAVVAVAPAVVAVAPAVVAVAPAVVEPAPVVAPVAVAVEPAVVAVEPAVVEPVAVALVPEPASTATPVEPQPTPVALAASVAEPAPVVPEPAVVTPVAAAPTLVAAAAAPVAPGPALDAAALTPEPVAAAASGVAGGTDPALAVYGPRFDAPLSAALAAPEASAPGRDSSRSRTRHLEVEDVLLIERSQGLQRAADMKGVWSQTTIPFEAIAAKTKLLTPSVGKVRATLTSGEIFEGGLYAVGEACVWIDTEFGRMGLQAARVKSIAQIDMRKGTPELGAPGSQNLAGLERVRVNMPGGQLYGKIIERNGGKVTIITEDGARLTLDAADVKPAAEAPKVVIKGR